MEQTRPIKTILITGASSGIGAALAVHYAAPHIVFVLQGRDIARLNDVATQCRARGAIVEILIRDVRDADGLAHDILAFDDRTPIDLVFANAGISGGPRDGQESAAQVKDIFDVNMVGVANTIMPLVPRMRARGCGQIAIVSSLAAFAPWPGAPAYAASKAGIKTFGLALRSALHHTGVRVNVVCPGFIDTPMTRVNPYHMPWMIGPQCAAQKIADGLKHNRAIIAFPWQPMLAARLIGALPYVVQQILLRGFPTKPPRPD